MSDYSKFPALHQTLEQIPYPYISWNEVITTYPSLSHLLWSFLFALICGLIQSFCHLISKIFAASLIGYSIEPPLPLNISVSLSSYYLKIGQLCNYTHHIHINKHNLKELSLKNCQNKISEKDLRNFLISCNEYHAQNRLLHIKFQEYIFPILLKTIVFIYGFYVISDFKWIYDRKLFYFGWPHNQLLDCCIPDIKLLYLFHCGFYIYRIYTSIFIDRHLTDFIPQIIHHVVSLMLIVISYYNGFIRIGVVILLLHDPADIILQSAKFCRLINCHNLCNLCFALLCVIWFTTRIIIYPYHCILSGFIDFPNEIQSIDNVNISVLYPVILTGMMCILYVLHLHWFRLLIAAVIRVLKDGKVDDPRSDHDN